MTQPLADGVDPGTALIKATNTSSAAEEMGGPRSSRNNYILDSFKPHASTKFGDRQTGEVKTPPERGTRNSEQQRGGTFDREQHAAAGDGHGRMSAQVEAGYGAQARPRK